MSDISQWNTVEERNVRIDDLTLSGEGGRYINKVMCAVKKKFNSSDTTLNKNTTAIGSWTDTTRTDTLKAAVEELESDVASIITDSQTVDMETIIDTDDVLSVSPGLLNWQKTEKAGAVTCYPVPGVTMEPVVEFKFTETPPEEGDKAPDNPGAITGASSVTVTRTGKNILSPSYYASEKTAEGISWAINDDGSISVTGTKDQGVSSCVFYVTQEYWNATTSKSLYLSPGTYILTGCPSGGGYATKWGIRVLCSSDDSQYVTNVSGDYGSGSSIIVTGKNVCVTIQINIWSSDSNLNLVFKPQLELATEATAYEKGVSNAYTISLGNTYYGGSIDLATGLMTVTHWGIALDGENDNFSLHGSSTEEYSYFQWAGIENGLLIGSSNQSCTHFVLDGNLSSVNTFVVYSSGGALRIKTNATDFPDLESFKSWLATQHSNYTPVVIYVQLATDKRYTVQLTPQQVKPLPALEKYEARLNTIYTDAESVQVGYAKSHIRTEYELTNAIVSLGSNL